MSEHQTAPDPAAPARTSVDVESASSAYDTFCAALRARGPTLNLLFEQARVSVEREGDTIVRDAFAGAVVTVLHGMLHDYWVSQSGTKYEWKHASAPANGWSVAHVLSASLDNLRHFEEWDSEKAALMIGRRSVKVLCSALAIPFKKTSKHAPFRGNVCWAVLETLSEGGGYGAIEALVREFAAALDQKRAS
ncbi:MAG TPA: hypothetical protein VFN37_01895 [Candidatus Baltobacteraceae bacterium]|nr:hypothetical protein [Candidatus Baltobacteraceae bacterium]